MLKKLVPLIVSVLLVLGTVGSACAALADLELLRVVYERTTGTTEQITDLGAVGTFLTGTHTIAGDALSATNASNLFVSYMAVNKTTGELWVSNSTTTAPVAVGTAGFNSTKTGFNSVYNYYNTLLTADANGVKTGTQSYANSFKSKLDASQGSLANGVNIATRVSTEASLASLVGNPGGAPVVQILYYFANANTGGSAGVPVATITTLADGSTVISPPLVPDAPTIGTATAGDGQATVTFTPPASNGGSAITGYIVTSSPGAKTATGTASPVTVTGLTNDTTYTFTVKAANVNGNGAASAASNGVMPVAATTSAPTATSDTATNVTDTTATLNGTVSANNASTSVSFDYGLDTGYGINVTAAQSPLATSAANSAVSASASGLSCNTVYHFRVVAVNSSGTSNGGDQTLTTTACAQGSQTIVFAPPSTATYGDAPLTLSATGGGSGNPVTFQVSGPATLSNNQLTITGAGTISVTASQAGNANYAAAPDLTASITVAPKPLTVSANNASRAFGAANPTNPGFTASGLVGTDNIGSVSYGYSATANATASVGSTHVITPSAALFASGLATNYTISYADGTLTISGQASQSISFTLPATKTYGDPAITLNATGGGSNSPVTFLVSGPATLSNNQLNITGAGTITVTASQAGNTNYAAAPDLPASITVAPKPLTVSANNVSRAFGAANPASPGFTAPALVGNDGIGSVTYTYAATANATAPAGSTHVITPSAALFASGLATNYTIAYADGTLTVAGVTSQTISFTPPATKTYGYAALNLIASASSTLQVSFTLVSGPALLNNNQLTITGAGIITVKASQAGNANYAAAPDLLATITVAPKPLTVTANNASRAFGTANPANPGFTSFGLVGTDSIGSVTYSYAATASPTATVGSSHGITPSTALFASGLAANYTIAYTDGTLTIAGLTSQAISFTTPATKTYGDPAIILSATGGGSGNPVTFKVSGPATLSNNQLNITGSGTITVTASQAGNTGYAAAPDLPATITVAPKPLTVTANNASRAFGAANPANPGFTAPGLVGTDSIGSVTYSYATTATTTAPIGSTHGITPSAALFASGSATSYTISYADGTLTIAGQASQTISFAPPATASYGDAPLTLGAAGGGSNNPVTFTLVSGPATLSNNQLTITGAGTISVTASQEGNANYAAASAVTKNITVSPVLPGAPAQASATAGDTQATVTFSAPAFTGGAAITSYIVTSAPGGFSGVGQASPITVTGLNNGTAYTFAVTAVNVVGSGPSVTSNSITPAIPPVTFTVTPTTSDANGSITPATSQTVAAGATASLKLVPAPGYQISSVTGSCGGTLNRGSYTYTTAGVVRDCSVIANFILIPPVKGDLDGDGKVTIVDALRALRLAILGPGKQTDKEIAVADVASPLVHGYLGPDGKIDIADVMAILKMAVK